MSLAQLLLSDGRFPAGGYAHSGGLEATVADGLAPRDVPRFVHDRLAAISGPECALALAAAAAAREDDIAALAELDDEAQARVPSPALRAASRRLGAQLLRTATAVWPASGIIDAYRQVSAATPRPVAFGVVAAGAGLSDSETAAVYLYEEAIMVTAAAVRLLPLDAADTTRWLVEAQPLLDRLAREAASHRGPACDLPVAFAPALELRSVAHAAREGRLFAT